MPTHPSEGAVIQIPMTGDHAYDTLTRFFDHVFRKADEYDSQRSFVGWACGFAKLEALKFRGKNRRGVLLEPDLIELLSAERENREAPLQARLNALEMCLTHLDETARELVRLRYDGRQSIDQILKTGNISRRTLMRRFGSIRKTLFTCVSRRLLTEE